MTLPQYFGDDILYITDGTDENTIDLNALLSLKSWERTIQMMKGDGVWQDSTMTDNRQLVDYRWATAIETFVFDGCGGDADKLAAKLADLREILLQAANFWLHPKKVRPVYLVRKHRTEKVVRYALIHGWNTPNDTSIVQKRDSLAHKGISAIDYTVFVERSAWRKNPPGLGECLEMAHYAIDYSDIRTAINFEAEDARGVVPHDATLAQIVDNDFAIDGWFKYDFIQPSSGYRGGYIMNMEQSGTRGWDLEIRQNSTAPHVRVTLTIYQEDFPFDGREIAYWDIETVTQPGTWFWMAISRKVGSPSECRVNGLLVPISGYSDDGVFIGVYTSSDLILGNDQPAYGNTCELKVSWLRLWSADEWFGDSDPVAFEGLCEIPTATSKHLACWFYSLGAGAIWEDVSPNTRDATLAETTLIQHCGETPDDPPTIEYCDGNIIKNGNGSPLTHIFNYDFSAGTYSANLVNDTEIAIGPDPQFVGDMCYIGCLYAPIEVLVFNLASAAGQGVVFAVYDGGWQNTQPTDTDETGGLLNIGVRRLFLNNVYTQQKTTINGVSAFWVRALIGAGGPHVAAKMADDYILNDHRNWLYFQNPGGEIGVETQFDITSKRDYSSVYRQSTGRAIMALRNMDETPEFRAALNFSDVYSGALDVYCSAGVMSFIDSVYASTRRCLSWTTTASSTAYDFATITIPASIADNFTGRFNMFVRAQAFRTDGFLFVDTFTLNLQVNSLGQTINIEQSIDTATPEGIRSYNLGTIELPVLHPGVLPLEGNVPEIEFRFWGNCNADGTLQLFDFWLMPADEMYIDTYSGANIRGLLWDYHLKTGSIKTLVRNLLSQVFVDDYSRIYDQWDYVAQRRFMIGSTGLQAVFFLFYTNWPDNPNGFDFGWSEPRMVYDITTEGNQLYLSAIAEGK